MHLSGQTCIPKFFHLSWPTILYQYHKQSVKIWHLLMFLRYGRPRPSGEKLSSRVFMSYHPRVQSSCFGIWNWGEGGEDGIRGWSLWLDNSRDLTRKHLIPRRDILIQIQTTVQYVSYICSGYPICDWRSLCGTHNARAPFGNTCIGGGAIWIFPLYSVCSSCLLLYL